MCAGCCAQLTLIDAPMEALVRHSPSGDRLGPEIIRRKGGRAELHIARSDVSVRVPVDQPFGDVSVLPACTMRRIESARCRRHPSRPQRVNGLYHAKTKTHESHAVPSDKWLSTSRQILLFEVLLSLHSLWFKKVPIIVDKHAFGRTRAHVGLQPKQWPQISTTATLCRCPGTKHYRSQ